MRNKEEAFNVIGEFQGNYYMARKELVKEMGLSEAVFFDVLRDWGNRFFSEDPYTPFFFSTEKVEELTGLTYKKQYTLYNNLKDANVIEWVIKGLPPKKWIVINWEVVANIIRKHRKIK